MENFIFSRDIKKNVPKINMRTFFNQRFNSQQNTSLTTYCYFRIAILTPLYVFFEHNIIMSIINKYIMVIAGKEMADIATMSFNI